VKVLLDKQGQPEKSRLQASDYLDRDSHESRLETDASAPRSAAR
jgi:hypothetical protein